MLTFGLALAAYTALGADLVTQLRGRPLRVVSALVVLLAASHVACVWALRYEWTFAKAVERGYGGFLMFTLVLVLLAAAPFLPERARRWITGGSFVLVTFGAGGAVFKFEAVEPLRWPVLAVPVVTVGLVGAGLLERRRGSTT